MTNREKEIFMNVTRHYWSSTTKQHILVVCKGMYQNGIKENLKREDLNVIIIN